MALSTLCRRAALWHLQRVGLRELSEKQQQLGDAEKEYKATLSIENYDPVTLSYMAAFYVSHGRYADARPLILRAIQLSTTDCQRAVKRTDL